MDVNTINNILIIIFFVLAAPLLYLLFIKDRLKKKK